MSEMRRSEETLKAERTLALGLLLVDVVETLGLNETVNEGTGETSTE